MTLLEKLNLEPSDIPDLVAKMDLVDLLLPDDSRKALHLLRWSCFQPWDLTASQFLAACEEWLSKN